MFEPEEGKIYDIVIGKDNQGVRVVSLVSAPAIEDDAVLLSDNEREEILKLQVVDEEKRYIIGAALIPGMLIPRIKNGKTYFIRYSTEQIEKNAITFFNYKNGITETNLEHIPDLKVNCMTFFQSWIVKDSDKDASTSLGKSYPVGTWVLGAYVDESVDGEAVWQMAKEGVLKGWSIEGMFDHVLSEETQEEKPVEQSEESEFISKCVKEVMDSGETDNNEQAVAICYSKWEKQSQDKKDFEWISNMIKKFNPEN